MSFTSFGLHDAKIAQLDKTDSLIKPIPKTDNLRQGQLGYEEFKSILSLIQNLT
jgi:hypothetical protein